MQNNTGNLSRPYTFAPTSVTVKCGGSVTVTNNTVSTHTFSPTNGGFTSTGDMSSHASRTVRFSYRGNYGFMCQIHTYMTGTVHVT